MHPLFIAAAFLLATMSSAAADEDRSRLVKAIVECRYILAGMPTDDMLRECHHDLWVATDVAGVTMSPPMPKETKEAVATALRSIEASYHLADIADHCGKGSIQVAGTLNGVSCEKIIRDVLDWNGFPGLYLYDQAEAIAQKGLLRFDASLFLRPMFDKTNADLQAAADRFRGR